MKGSQLLRKKQTKIFYKKKVSKKFIKKKVSASSDTSNSKEKIKYSISVKNAESDSLKQEKKQKVSSHQNRNLHTIFKRYEFDMQLILIPLILLIVLEIVNLLNTRVLHVVAQYRMSQSTALSPIYPYPFLKSSQLPYVTANAAVIMDAQTHAVLYSKNPQLRLSMASTTKIMTALVSLSFYKNDSILTIKSPHVDGTVLGFYPGERFYYQDLLYAMLLPSANDAAQAIADNYPGGANAFVAKMNEKAKSLDLSDIHYSDAVGLDDDGDYSTVIDLARLASIAIKNIEFTDVTGTKQTEIEDIDQTSQYPLENLNELLGIDGVTGIKTGTTEGAGEVLVTSDNINGRVYIIVVMQSQNRFSDTQSLLNFLHNNIQFAKPIPSISIIP